MGNHFKNIGLVLLLSLPLQAQKSTFIYEKGFLIGYGYGTNSKSLPEGTYRVIYSKFKLSTSLFKNRPSPQAPFYKALIYLEPQYNTVYVKADREWEAGISLGFQPILNINKYLQGYLMASIGPHWFSASTQRQAPGFIFSDQLGVGGYVFLKQRIALNIAFRLRHLSNANTRFPNFGINSHNFLIGLSWINR